MTEIDSTDFKKENLTTKIRRNKAENEYFFKKIFQKILKQTKPSIKTSTSKDIGETNKSIKQLRTAGSLHTKDQAKKKNIICLYLQKVRQKNNQQNERKVPKKIIVKKKIK